VCLRRQIQPMRYTRDDLKLCINSSISHSKRISNAFISQTITTCHSHVDRRMCFSWGCKEYRSVRIGKFLAGVETPEMAKPCRRLLRGATKWKSLQRCTLRFKNRRIQLRMACHRDNKVKVPYPWDYVLSGVTKRNTCGQVAPRRCTPDADALWVN